jgi:hypothetical protein
MIQAGRKARQKSKLAKTYDRSKQLSDLFDWGRHAAAYSAVARRTFRP